MMVHVNLVNDPVATGTSKTGDESSRKRTSRGA
jgi:hypothetical protein